MAERYSRRYLRIMVVIHDLGDSAMRSAARRQQKWDGWVPWEPSRWFPNDRKDAISRAVKELERNGLLERFIGGSRKRGEVRSRTTKVRLTAKGQELAIDAKYGRVKPDAGFDRRKREWSA